MRLAVEMAVMNMDGEISAVAVGEDNAKFHGMLRLNEEASDIIAILNLSREKGISFDNLVKSLQTKYTDSILRKFQRLQKNSLRSFIRKDCL